MSQFNGMNVFGELIRAQLQNSASDLTPTATGLVYFNTSTGLKFYDGSAWRTAATLNNTQTLTNKSLDDATTAIVDSSDATIKIQLFANGTTGTSTQIAAVQTANRVLTLPDATDTLVGKATTDTLTNKTLTSPNINAGVITSADIDGSTAANTSRITLPKAATATLNALTRKQGTLVYDTTTGEVKFDDGATLTALAAATPVSGTYTPTVSNKTGTLSGGTATSFTAQYYQVGTVVTVSGKMTLQATGGGDGGFDLTIPVTSAFAAEENCGGAIQTSNGSTVGLGVKAVAATARVQLNVSFGTVASISGFFTFTYRII